MKLQFTLHRWTVIMSRIGRNKVVFLSTGEMNKRFLINSPMPSARFLVMHSWLLRQLLVVVLLDRLGIHLIAFNRHLNIVRSIFLLHISGNSFIFCFRRINLCFHNIISNFLIFCLYLHLIVDLGFHIIRFVFNTFCWLRGRARVPNTFARLSTSFPLSCPHFDINTSGIIALAENFRPRGIPVFLCFFGQGKATFRSIINSRYFFFNESNLLLQPLTPL
mmetsp:Transcript_12326/g.18923  ORF Transcript_12326/g.18923 Transcript_12326/m.18923 type:complete len:220 (-) Transcript_12326:2996-3655(-)